MKKLFFGTMLLALVSLVPAPAMARVDVGISIGLPPLVFAAPPEVIVLPDTVGVYVVPDIDEDLYFWDGFWWRFWEGRWYRSHYYNRGWRYYSNVPTFYFDVDPEWREHYRHRDWYGHPWNYEPIPQRRLQRNWRTWQNNNYWERRGTWGVQGYQPRPLPQRRELRQQRQQQYQLQPQVRQPRGQQPQIQQPQRQPQQPQVRQPQQQPERQQQQPQTRQQRQQRPGEQPEDKQPIQIPGR